MNSFSASREWYIDTISTMVQGGRTPEAAAQHLAREFPRDAVLKALSAYYDMAGKLRDFGEPGGLIDRGRISRYKPWYVGPSDGDVAWPPLAESLKNQGLPPSAVSSIDAATNRILALLPSPGEPEFSARGLVVGYVQSGKTANYSGLIAKASDKGYKLFIVLAGIHNTLRSQTQGRLNRELRDLAPTRWLTLTDEDTDFEIRGGIAKAASVLAPSSNQRLLIVIKKNNKRLGRLLAWLEAAGRDILGSCATMVIDDEADQAGINVRDNSKGASETGRSAINNLIVELLRLMPKVSYVGYTATPFANVLVDPSATEDLYPRDFILDLPKPDGYFGAETIFGRERLDAEESDESIEGLDVVRIVPVEEAPLLQPKPSNHETFEPTVTQSLSRALDYFWLATAARRARGHTDEHSSMLVHTTLYASVHGRISDAIGAYAKQLLGRLDSDATAQQALRGLWGQETSAVASRYPNPTEFELLRPHLRWAIESSELTVENGLSDERLSYATDSPKIVVVTGGNTLSRGLTLEGLVVSYFIRAAKAYDTLLQMGRWFGYRRGYEDLPRIWMTQELENWFRSLALVEHQLRNEVAKYAEERVTPTEYGPKIRTHPALAITSELKMQSAVKANVSYGGRVVQTIIFNHADVSHTAANRAAVNDLLEPYMNGLQSQLTPTRLLATGVPAKEVMSFISMYRFHEANRELQQAPLTGYIRKQVRLGHLTTWNVAVVGRGRTSHVYSIGDCEVGMLERSKLEGASTPDSAYLGVVTSKADFGIDVDGYPDGEVPWQVRRDAGPLMLIYPINRDSAPGRDGSPSKRGQRVPLEAVDDLFGLAFVFPEPDELTEQEYMTVDMSRFEWEEEVVLDDMAGDEADDAP